MIQSYAKISMEQSSVLIKKGTEGLALVTKILLAEADTAKTEYSVIFASRLQKYWLLMAMR